MSSVHIKCITRYTREVSLACECTHEVCVHARTYIFRRKCTHAHAKIASKSQILEKYSVIPRKNLAKAHVSFRASVKLNLSCTVIQCNKIFDTCKLAYKFLLLTVMHYIRN